MFTFKDFRKDIEEFKILQNKTNTLISTLELLFGERVYEAPVVEHMHILLDKVLYSIMFKYDDVDEWIPWFIYDNEWGANKLESYDEKSTKITTLRHLWSKVNKEK